MNYGLQKDENIWCHKFLDCSFAYFIQEACHEMPAELLCVLELILLRNHDQQKNTDYKTLKIYLDNKMNASQSAKILYIHLTSMSYRLKRLKELTDIYFEDLDKMLYLTLSFKMLYFAPSFATWIISSAVMVV